MGSGDIFSIEPGADGEAAVAALRVEEDPFPQYVTPDEISALGSGAVKTYAFTILADGQLNVTLPIQYTPVSVFEIVYDGCPIPEALGLFTVSAPRTINFLFNVLVDSVVVVKFQ